MSLELVMNADGALGHGPLSPISKGTFVITSIPSTTNKAKGKGVYSGDLQYTFSGGDAAGADSGTVATTAPQKIEPTAVKTKADGSFMIRLGDTGTMSAQGTSGGTPVPVSGPVEVSDAGQDKVYGQ